MAADDSQFGWMVLAGLVRDALEDEPVLWGSVAEWVGAVGTVLAFAVAAAAYAWSVSISRQAQARKITITGTAFSRLKAGDQILNNTAARGVEVEFRAGVVCVAEPAAQITTIVTNHSDEVMGPFRIDLVKSGTASLVANAEYTFQTLAPSESIQAHLLVPDEWHPNHPSLLARIVFRDASGRWWQRLEAEAIRRAPQRTRSNTHAADAKAVRELIPSDPPAPKKRERMWRPAGPGDMYQAD